MKRLLLAVVMLLAFGPAGALAKNCSNESLKGTYTYAFEANPLGGGPFAAVVGTITFDGKGGFTGTNYQNFGGGGPVVGPFAGTYTVNPDCTSTSEFDGSHTFSIIAHNGDKIRVLNTDPGFILAFTAEKEPDEK